MLHRHDCEGVALPQVCEQTGEDLVTCAGQCYGSYHLHCIGVERSAEKILCTACSTGELYRYHVNNVMFRNTFSLWWAAIYFHFQVYTRVSPVRSLKERCDAAVCSTVVVSIMRPVCG